jgi:hypothetical protein
MRTLGGNVPIGSNARSPRFRRVPFVRDVVFDHGRASTPRITGSHMLPSTLLTVSASAELWFSRLNSTPHTITVYASLPPSPATTQHSLPGARYGLPGPDFHRQDHASFAWRTSNPSHGITDGWMDCFASLAMTAVGPSRYLVHHDLVGNAAQRGFLLDRLDRLLRQDLGDRRRIDHRAGDVDFLRGRQALHP